MPTQISIRKPIPQVPDLKDESLVGSWLNYRVANSGKDFSVYRNDLTIFGNPKPQKDGGYDLNGSADYLKRSQANWRSTDSAGTIEAWIKRDVAGVAHCIFASSDEGSNNYALYIAINSSNYLLITQYNNDIADTVRSSNTLSAGIWNHIVIMSSGTAYSLYINGNIETPVIVSGTNSGDWFADTLNRDNITIGVHNRNALEYYFNGIIYQVNVYSEVKTADWDSEQFKLGVPE